MTLGDVYRALFPDELYIDDAAALAEIRMEVETLREQLSIRLRDLRQMLIEHIRRSRGEDGLAVLLWLSRDLAEQEKLILGRGKVPAARSRDEIQRAHDILGAVILNPTICGAIYGSNAEETLPQIVCNMDVLCWALGHDHIKTFGENLATIETSFEQLGLEMVDT